MNNLTDLSIESIYVNRLDYECLPNIFVEIFDALYLSKTPVDYPFIADPIYLNAIMGKSKDSYKLIPYHFKRKNFEYVDFLFDKLTLSDFITSLYSFPDVSSLQFLISKGVTIEYLKYNNTLFEYTQSFDTLKLLISHGLILDYLRADDNRVLRWATQKNNLDVVELLLAQGLTLEDIRSNSNSALFYAVSKGNVEIVKLFMSKGLTIEDLKSNDNAALQYAARFGRVEMVELLLSYGLDINDTRDDDNKALTSVSRYNIEMIKILMTRVFTIDDIKLFDNLAFRRACYCCQVEIVDLFISIGLTIDDIRIANNSGLINAVRSGHIEMVKFLISRGLTLDDIRDDDNKALRYAASLGDIEMVNFLMDQGLNINDLRSNNNYAVKKAAYFGHIEMVKLLISYGLTIRDVRNDYSLIYYIYLFNANEVDMEDIKHQCISGLERSADGNLEMFKLFYEIYTRYNFTGFQFQNIEYKDVIRYLVSKGHKTDKLGFENVYLM